MVYHLHEQDGVTARVVVNNEAPIDGFNLEMLKPALQAVGWSDKANVSQANLPVIVTLLLVLVIALALITGPQTAVLAEL